MNTVGHKKSRPVTIGNKMNQPMTMGNKLTPKSYVLGSVHATPTGEIVNYANDKNQSYNPIKGDQYKEAPRKNGLERK